MKAGQSYAQLYERAGQPFDSLHLQRWTYKNGSKLLIDQNKVYDYELGKLQLDTEDHKLLRPKDPKSTNNPFTKLRIGIDSTAVTQLVGLPQHIDTLTLYTYHDYQQIFVHKGIIESINLHAHATMAKFDKVRLNFTQDGMLVINISIALIMFGIALDLKAAHFKQVLREPKAFIVGVVSQFIALPLLTFILILIWKPTASVAMGMILVAASPGGNISNFISSISRANLALSISLTSFATIITVIATPFNFSFWGSLYAGTSGLVVPIHINLLEMLKVVVLILGLPVVAGILTAAYLPRVAKLLYKPLRVMSLLFFIGLVIGALVANFNFFLDYIHLVMLIVFAHNLLALLSGFGLSTIFKLSRADRRTITIETGIQNSGLALVLIFNPNLFDGLGGMAFIAAWWGIWHIVSGLSIAAYWNRRDPEVSN